MLQALQNPLYRLLEGYLFWPRWAYHRGCERQRRLKQSFLDRLDLGRMERRERQHVLEPDEASRLAALRANTQLQRRASASRSHTAVQHALLRERLRRYPVDDAQVAPTRLGNAIRRLEEYGHDRYRLDTQVLWNELCGVVPEQIRRQVESGRTSVDFFVALLYGHIAVAATALGGLLGPDAKADRLVLAAIVVLGATPLWYRCAVTSTDEWAAAVRAMVNVGRKPLAASMGLALPATVEEERRMWAGVCKMSRLPYHPRAAALDDHRDTSVRGPG
ncbi:hypothetical protein ACFYUY_24010 [Kitasatospora sp. NPDC004745]|uniref:hypothetical protein n=1 Tax=Kitasatospora sp. NPDC004745 TaxID=3364019 RepID=UPI00369E72BB